MSDTVQLMLVAECDAAMREPLTAALDRFDVSCVLIVPPGWQPTSLDDDAETVALPALDHDVCRALVELIQGHDAAALVANDAALAQAVGADGCHLDHSEALEEAYRSARGFLGTQAIVGVMPGGTRHMAMTLAEAGTDYTGFAVTGDADDQGADRVGWWAEIFESPVVAFTSGDIGICRRAIEARPPDLLGLPLPADGDLQALAAVAKLIEECGQLPVAAKDAK